MNDTLPDAEQAEQERWENFPAQSLKEWREDARLTLERLARGLRATVGLRVGLNQQEILSLTDILGYEILDLALAASILDRLAYLLGLSEGERRFVQGAADEPTDHVNLQVFADWLEDAGRPAEAESVRRLTPEDGSLLVYRFPNTMEGREETRKCAQAMRKQFDEVGRRTEAVYLPSDPEWGLTHLSPQTNDVLAITYPREGGAEAARKLCDELRASLKAAGRDVYVAAVPTGYTIEQILQADAEQKQKEVARVAARIEAAITNKGWVWGGNESPEIRSALLAATRLREDNDALKAELADLLREKREARR